MNRKTIIITLAVVGLIAALIGVYFYQQKTPDAAAYATDHAVSATELFQAYESDESAADALYLGKTIEVKGELREIARNPETGSTTVHLEAGGLLGGVTGELAAGQTTDLQVGEELTIKGICSGMLMDVVLNRCVIL